MMFAEQGRDNVSGMLAIGPGRLTRSTIGPGRLTRSTIGPGRLTRSIGRLRRFTLHS